MAKKYHVTDKGEVNECKAEIGECPLRRFQTIQEHFVNEKDARVAYEQYMGDQQGIVVKSLRSLFIPALKKEVAAERLKDVFLHMKQSPDTVSFMETKVLHEKIVAFNNSYNGYDAEIHALDQELYFLNKQP